MPKPVKHVFICSQSRPEGHPRGSCAERGCGEVMEAFGMELQNRGCYDKVAVTATGCLGPCGYGANVLVYPDGILYNGVSGDDVKEIFEQHLLENKPVERLIAPADVW